MANTRRWFRDDGQVIVVAGEALVDLVVSGEAVTATPGGAPYNVARGCARLGAPTALLATLSSDGFGSRLAAGLVESGVDRELLQRTDRPTTLAVAQLDATGAASYRFYTEGTSAPALAPGRLPDGVGALVTGGLGLVLEPIATAIESTVLAAGPDVLVLVDLNCRPAAIDDGDAYRARLEARAAPGRRRQGERRGPRLSRTRGAVQHGGRAPAHRRRDDRAGDGGWDGDDHRHA